MKTTSTTTEILMTIPWLIAIVYVTSIWPELPATMPSHYDLSGTVNGWSPKVELAWLSLGMGVFLYLLFRFLPKIDPKGRLQSANFQKLRFVMMLFLAALQASLFYLAVHQSTSQALLGPELALVSLMLAGIGNYITTVKPNWFIGIRTPWTLSSENVWRRTHQLGGRWMVAGGLLAALLAIVVPAPYTVGVVVGIILTASFIPIVYSYIYYRQEKARQFS
ncbi:SdpI family protein [Spirosoma agri]|uniref:DUF1648 domain-containing protein n=1 Tax=Spirosoma agri TaxID=1987381 RepID=A0A6M0IFK4_9BACT|nr:SdpI family protein [Spirosoma agri]NEU67049.1 DUF1648 domain-containing protein [Spirosoma agri]